MAKRPIVEFILNLINFILIICSFCILGHGLISLSNWKQNLSKKSNESNVKHMVVHHILLAIHSSNYSSDLLPKAWFIYLLFVIGAIVFITSCVGFIGTSLRSPCCLIFHFLLLLALVLCEIGATIFIFVKHNWKKGIPIDRSGTLQSVYNFLYEYWNIIRWIIIGVFILQVVATILALYLLVVFNRSRYDESENVVPIVNIKGGWTNSMQPLQTSKSPPTPTTVALKGYTKMN